MGRGKGGNEEMDDAEATSLVGGPTGETEAEGGRRGADWIF